jgi:hypothetical protein
VKPRSSRLIGVLFSSVFVLSPLAPPAAFAQQIPLSPPPAPPAPLAAPPATQAWGGVAVIAVDGSIDAAWSLARALYADAALRPPRLDDATARVLAGEPAAEGAPLRLRDLAALRAAIHGDDAPSRRLLLSLRQELGVSLILLVDQTASGPRARLFAGAGFDEDLLVDEAPPRPTSWSRATMRVKARAPAPPPVREAPAGPRGSTILSSGWFWGALGLAAAAGLTVFALSRRSSGSSSAIPVQVH